MSTYGLLEHFEDVQDPKQHKEHSAFNEASDDHINKMVFQDKKLNKLWLKAERSGFTGNFELYFIYKVVFITISLLFHLYSY